MALLEGTRILSLAEQYPGPMATMILADLGADVVMLERPAGGDPTRTKPHFDGINRNKRSVCIDLREAEGQRLAADLAAASDAVIVGFRPTAAKRLGIDYRAMVAANPRVVYLALSGYGATGPYAQRPGHDLSFQAMAGILGRDDTGRSRMPHLPLADYISALYAALGIALGLREVERTGRGLSVDLSMLDSLLAVNGPSIVAHLNDDPAVVHPPRDPGYGVYALRDGRDVALSVSGESHLWRDICDALGLSDIRDLDVAERVERRNEVERRLRDRFSELTWEEVDRMLRSLDAAYAPVNSLADIAADAVIRGGRLLVRTGEDASGKWAVRQPLRFEGFADPALLPVPDLGAHTDEVLSELGLDGTRLADLRARGVIGANR